MTRDLERALEGATGVERFELLDALSIRAVQRSADEARAWAMDALEVARELGDLSLESRALRRSSIAVFYLGDLDAALELADRARELCVQHGDKLELANVALCLGAYYRRRQEYARALEFQHEALNSARELGERVIESKACNNIGLIYTNLGWHTEALHYYYDALAAFDHTRNNTTDYIYMLNNIGLLHVEAGEPEKTIEVGEKAVALGEAQELDQALINAHFNMGLAWERLERTEDSHASYQAAYVCAERVGGTQQAGYMKRIEFKLRAHQANFAGTVDAGRESIRLFEEARDERLASGVRLELATYYMDHGEFELASELIEHALEHGVTSSSLEVERVARTARVALYKRSAQLELALDELEALRQTERAMNAHMKATQLAMFEARYRSELEQIEAQLLKEQNERLEREVARQTAALRQARDQALAANRAKDRFLAVASHELRTPLNAITGYTELVRDELGDVRDGAVLDAPEMIEDLSNVLEAASHLKGLVERVLELSSMASEQATVHIDDVDPAELVERAAERYADWAERRGNVYIVDTDGLEGESMRTDRFKLRQTLACLIENAHKFTQDGEVCVIARTNVGLLGERWLQVIISDTGEGMDEATIARVTEAFALGDDTPTRPQDGLGIGLALCKHHTSLLGGRLEISARPGEGSRFELSIPYDIGEFDEGADT